MRVKKHIKEKLNIRKQIVMENNELYESDEVVSKYGSFKTRVRQLNIPERELIDTFDVCGKDVLILGSGAGRVPANFSLFNNNIYAIELSKKLFEISLSSYPKSDFKRISFINGDALNLSNLCDRLFDVIFFPMNGIDLLADFGKQKKLIEIMSDQLKPNGILCFTSHNIKAYALSPKLSSNQRSLSNLFKDAVIEEEKVVGGGVLCKTSQNHFSKIMSEFKNLRLENYIYDARNKIERRIALNKFLASLYFPYVMYVYRKI